MQAARIIFTTIILLLQVYGIYFSLIIISCSAPSMNDMSENLEKILLEKRWRLAVAESCTGGRLADFITNRPGSSRYFAGGVIAYSNRVKSELLGVGKDLLEEEGAVSEAAARAMVRGVIDIFSAQAGIAVTGIAGPGGGTAEKPVGLVCIATLIPGKEKTVKYLFRGSRGKIKNQSVAASLKQLLEM